MHTGIGGKTLKYERKDLGVNFIAISLTLIKQLMVTMLFININI